MQMYGARIAWINETYPNVQDVTDEHFIVWMRTAALPTFRKLYARIDHDIPANTLLRFAIGANFPIEEFGATKSIVVSTASVLGGRSFILAAGYAAMAVLCWMSALALLLRFSTAYGVGVWDACRNMR